MSRSVTRSTGSRNFVGGLIGGTLGFVAPWYFAPPALPIGVLLGILVGWWAEDIVELFFRSFRSAVGLLKHRETVKAVLYARLRRYVSAINSAARWVGTALQHVVTLPVLLFVWPLLLLRRVRSWVMQSAGTALLITISAILIGAVINAVIIVVISPWPETITIGGGPSGKPEEVVPFGWSGIAFATTIGTFLLTMFGAMGAMVEYEKSGSGQSFNDRGKRYSQYSPVTYFLRELFRFFKAEVACLIFLAFAFVYWATIGGALIALVTIPVAAFVTFMVGLYKIATRLPHWWCFAVTLVVTGVSALLFYGSIDNEAMLWAVALCTGFVSGLTTEGLRRLALWWSNTRPGQYYLELWSDEKRSLVTSIAVPAWRAFGRGYDTAGQRLIGYAA